MSERTKYYLLGWIVGTVMTVAGFLVAKLANS